MLDQFIAPIYERIYALARNYWWSWDDESESLFNELDPVRWRELDHNPIALLSEITLDQLEERASQRVLLFDGDLGLANVDIQLGLTPTTDLSAVFAGRSTLQDAAMPCGKSRANFVSVAGFYEDSDRHPHPDCKCSYSGSILLPASSR